MMFVEPEWGQFIPGVHIKFCIIFGHYKSEILAPKHNRCFSECFAFCLVANTIINISNNKRKPKQANCEGVGHRRERATTTKALAL
jgi:hypothetical protein